MTDDEPPPDEVEIPIEDHLDLHAFAPRDVTAVVASYLEAAVERGYPEVRLIHGKGIGVQRAAVRRLLDRHPSVLAYRDDDALRGGWGATIVTLRPGN
jgi:DNA-nicking Smr family endonuclease